MTIRFSAARRRTNSAVARALCPRARLDAANDNPRPGAKRPSGLATPQTAPAPMPFDLPIVPEALRHFARHGLSAALHARLKAEAAQALGDQVACTRWLAICRQFDRRMAETTARSFDRAH